MAAAPAGATSTRGRRRSSASCSTTGGRRIRPAASPWACPRPPGASGQSDSAIGKSVRLSEAAGRQRVSRLIDSAVMEIVAVTDPLSLGFARQAMVGLKVRGDISAVADRLHDYDEIDYLVVTAGS